jgi:hypothetical protein
MRKGVRIASPCSAAWEGMSGDSKVRFCPKCQLNVYNFREMPEGEINQLLLEREGRLCAKIYQRASGSILTKDSPVAFRILPRLPGSAELQPETVDLLIGKQQTILRETPTVSRAQANETAISLLAYDAIGVGASGVAFSIHNRETRSRTTEYTDQSGRLKFSGIPAGTYSLDCETPGLAMQRQLIEIAEGEIVQMEVELFSTKMGMVVKVDVGIVPHQE